MSFFMKGYGVIWTVLVFSLEEGGVLNQKSYDKNQKIRILELLDTDSFDIYIILLTKFRKE